jgi:hypothetical protein
MLTPRPRVHTVSGLQLTCTPVYKEHFWHPLKVVTNEKGEALGEVLTIIC